MKWRLPLGNYETIGGMILEYTGKIPNVNEKIKMDHFEVTILRVSHQRIRFVKIKRI
jgi:CBS domain containing-hemolysin-like protein